MDNSTNQPLHLPTGLITAEELSKRLEKRGVCVSADRLLEYTEIGYIPHWKWKFGKEESSAPMFLYKEVIDWFETNCLTHHAGLPFPSAVLVAEDYGTPIKTDETIPTILLGMRNVLRCTSATPICGVYFLCRSNEVVYVGKSVCIHSRIIEHHKDKIFDKILFLPVPRSDIEQVEGSFIRTIKPEYNKNNGAGKTELDASITNRYGYGTETINKTEQVFEPRSEAQTFRDRHHP